MTYTATADLTLPATVIGSWPRPSWFTESMWGRPLDTAMMDVRYREQFEDALAVVISDQERAGLDIVTNGDYFLDADFAGRSWHHYPLQRWLGLEHDELQPADTRSPILGDQQGTLLQEIYTSWRWPIVTGKIRANPRNPLGYAKIWRMSQVRAHRPVKFGTVSGQVMALFLDSHTPEYAREDAGRQMIWDMATAINQELRELVASGCRVVQVEEPTIHFTSAYTPEDRDTLEFLVDALNHEISGLEEAEVWVHTCWGNPMMQRVFDRTSYADAIELYLDRVNCDVWTLEMKDRAAPTLSSSAGGARRSPRRSPSAPSATDSSKSTVPRRSRRRSVGRPSSSTSTSSWSPRTAASAARGSGARTRSTRRRRSPWARTSSGANTVSPRHGSPPPTRPSRSTGSPRRTSSSSRGWPAVSRRVAFRGTRKREVPARRIVGRPSCTWRCRCSSDQDVVARQARRRPDRVGSLPARIELQPGHGVCVADTSGPGHWLICGIPAQLASFVADVVEIVT